MSGGVAMTASATPSSGERSRFELTLAMLGAVCGALVTGVLEVLDVPTTGKFVGLGLGAALPPFVAVVGRRRPLRVTAAVMLTGVALVLAYSGLAAFSVATDEPSILPSPIRLVTGGGGVGSGTKVGDLGISVYPDSLSCDSGGCEKVAVTSTGSALLKISSVEFQPESAKSYLTASGCEGAQLNNGDNCTIEIKFDAQTAPHSVSAKLVIHQNLKGPATLVPITGQGDVGTVDPKPNFFWGTPVVCTFSGSTLSVSAPINSTGSIEADSLAVALLIDGRPAGSQYSAEISSGRFAATVTIRDHREGVEQPSRVRLELDSSKQVDERDEKDNFKTCVLN
jgi:CARDB